MQLIHVEIKIDIKFFFVHIHHQIYILLSILIWSISITYNTTIEKKTISIYQGHYVITHHHHWLVRAFQSVRQTTEFDTKVYAHKICDSVCDFIARLLVTQPIPDEIKQERFSAQVNFRNDHSRSIMKSTKSKISMTKIHWLWISSKFSSQKLFALKFFSLSPHQPLLCHLFASFIIHWIHHFKLFI